VVSVKPKNLVIAVLFVILIILFIPQKSTTAEPPGWSEDIRLTYNTNNSANPVIGVWENYVHVFWCEQTPGPGNEIDIFYRRSTDVGKTWEDTRKLIDTDKTLSGLSVAINKSTIHLVWSDKRSGANYIYYTNSSDNGDNWEVEKIISAPSSGGYDPDIAVNDNYIHVVYWHDFKLFYMNSTDNGISWSEVQQLTGPIRDSKHPSIAVNETNIHIVWLDHYDKNGQGTAGAIFYMNSTDGGLTWSEDINLTEMDLDAAYPYIAVNGSIIHVVYSKEVTGLWQGYYRRSEDNGILWFNDVKILNSSTDIGVDGFAIDKDKIHVIGGDDYISDKEIYYVKGYNNGHNWNPQTRLTFFPEDSGRAKIVVYNGKLHVVWRDYRDGNLEIYYKQYPVYADLSISSEDISFSDNIPNIGIPTQINATILNIGDENASATIEFWDGDPDNGGVFINSTDVTVNFMEKVNATINWIPTINGTHNIYVKIKNTLETNLSNNIANKSVLVNREPELHNIPSTYSLNEDSIINQLINLSEYANDDFDSWDELTFSVISYFNSSIVNVSIFDGHFLRVDALTDSANDNWTGTLEIVIEVIDTFGRANVSNQFTVTVTEVNDAPIVINSILNFNIEEDTSDSTTVNLTNVFFDSDNSSLYYTCSGNTHINVIAHENGLVTFTPSENWTGSETIIFYATDNLSSPASDSVTISITPVNDTPIVVGTISDFNMDEDTVVESIIDLIEIFQDVDNATLYYFYSGSNNISVIIHENGTVSFIPAENWSGIETIVFYATDNLTDPISEDVTITVIPINDAPVVINPVSDFNMFEDTVNSIAVNLNSIFYDVDNAKLYYYYSGNIDIAVVINQDGSVTFTPKQNWTGSETLTFYASDNLSSPVSEDVTITVVGINDPPIVTVLSPLNNSNYFTSDTIYFNITVFDVDSESFTYLWDFSDGNTSSMKNATHQYSEVGVYNVTISVNDGSDSVTRIVTIVVEPETTDSDGNGVIDDDGSDTLTYFWILLAVIIVVIMLFLFVWHRSKIQKDDSETEIDSTEDENELSE
jgi:hypothetical protein